MERISEVDASAEVFFSNGIVLHKLRTTTGRYFNTASLVKLFAFEPFYVTMQTLHSYSSLC
jgi:hypothetical protein